jgi:RimJ/RimL family protein N-acetyltransferase
MEGRPESGSVPGFAVEKVDLEGGGVRLEPLDESRHHEGLAAAIRDGELWKLPVTNVPHPDDLGPFFADAESAFAEGRELAFATIDLAAGRIAGSTRFRMIAAEHLRVEIGFTFLAAGYQRTRVNTTAKLLMLTHAFETWRVNRVEFLTDRLNDPSRTAILRIGAREEGLLRSHMVMRDGRIRDSVIFSIIRPEWPAVKAALESRLGSG